MDKLQLWHWILIFAVLVSGGLIVAMVWSEERRKRRDLKPSKLGPTVDKYNAMLREHYSDATIEQLTGTSSLPRFKLRELRKRQTFTPDTDPPEAA